MLLIKPDRNPATIISCHETVTQNGKGQVTFEFKLDSGDTFIGHRSLEGGAFEYTVAMLDKVIAWNRDPKTLNEQAEGKRCVVVIVMKPGYKDSSKLWPELDGVYPEGGSAAKPVTSGSRLIAAMRLPRADDAPPPNPKITPKPAAPVSSVTPPDDGMPF
jgi:hypothetical protein